MMHTSCALNRSIGVWMENEEPNVVVPRPFPHEPSEVLERSASLDVTPERVLVTKSRLQRKQHRGKLNNTCS